MTKKKEEENTAFDLNAGLKELNKPDWVIKAFTKVIDLSNVKTQTGLEKEFKKFMEMK